MIMSYIWTGMVLLSVLCAAVTGNQTALSASVLDGAQSGITLALSIAGALCLWSGVGRVLEKGGITALLARWMKPLLQHLFPSSRDDSALAGSLSGNLCANLLGLGNAATPMGIDAVRRMAHGDTVATDEMCRLIVLNTASIQLIPANVAAVRGSLGCAAPFDILPAVWVSSLLSAGSGVLRAVFLGKLWRHA